MQVLITKLLHGSLKNMSCIKIKAKTQNMLLCIMFTLRRSQNYSSWSTVLACSRLWDSRVRWIEKACWTQNKNGRKLGRGGARLSFTFYFLFFPASPTFRVPFTFASSPLSESLEQASAVLHLKTKRLLNVFHIPDSPPFSGLDVLQLSNTDAELRTLSWP